MKDYLKKFSSIFHSPGIAATVRWSKCVHLRVFLICVLTVVATICSLGFTIATKELVDGAVSSNMDAIRCFGILKFQQECGCLSGIKGRTAPHSYHKVRSL